MLRFAAISLFILISSFAGAQEKWTLERCIMHALENNLQIRSSRVDEGIARNNRTQAYADFLPNINGEANYGVNYGRSLDITTYDFVNQRIQTSSISASAALTLFSGLNKVNTLKRTQFDVSTAQYATEDVINVVSLNITSLFLTILLNTETQKTAGDRLKLSEAQVEQTTKLVNAGVLPEGNLLDVVAARAADSLTYIVAKNGVELSKLNLAILLQLDDPAAFDVEIPEVEVSTSTVLKENTAANIYNTALNNQASVKSATYAVKSAEKSLAAMRGLYYPNLNFFYNLRTSYSSIATNRVGGYDSTFTLGVVNVGGTDFPIQTTQFIPVLEKAGFFRQYGDNFNHTVGLSLAIPIFNGLQTRTAVKNMELQSVKAKIALKTVQDRLKNDVYVAYADANAAYRRFQAAQNSVTALERSFEYVTKKFNLGAATTLEYSTSSNSLLNVQSEMIQAKYDYIFKLKVLDYYLGNRITLN